jgi:hypothetical protein
MSVTQAAIGYGVKFQRGDGASPEVFSDIAEVKDVKFSGPTLGTVDATHSASPNSYKEFIPSLIDPGDMDVTLQFIPGNSGQKNLIADLAAKTLRNFKVQWPAGEVWAFAGFVTSFPTTGPIEGIMSASVKVKISGAITFPA